MWYGVYSNKKKYHYSLFICMSFTSYFMQILLRNFFRKCTHEHEKKNCGEHKKVPHFQENRERHSLGNAILTEQQKQQPRKNRKKKK